jgi:hypothetical protein
MSGKDGSAVPPPPGLFGIGGNNQGGWGQPNQGQWGQQQGGNTSGDIVIRPIEGSFLEDLDTFTKMVTYCLLRILSAKFVMGNHCKRVRSASREANSLNGPMF